MKPCMTYYHFEGYFKKKSFIDKYVYSYVGNAYVDAEHLLTKNCGQILHGSKTSYIHLPNM